MQRPEARIRAKPCSGDVANDQTIVAEVVVGCANRGYTIPHLYSIDYDVAVDHALAAVILYVYTIKARFGMDVTDRDVLRAVGNLDWAAEP